MVTNIEDDCMGLHICPHCTNKQARYNVEDDVRLIMYCTCGYNKIVYDDSIDNTVMHVLTKRKSELPRRGSKISLCLGAVASIHPNRIQTQKVAQITGDTVSGAGTKLMVLQHKGLVEKYRSLRGIAGGSSWFLTNRALEYLNIKAGGL